MCAVLGRGGGTFDGTKYLTSTIPRNGVLGAPQSKPKACFVIWISLMPARLRQCHVDKEVIVNASSLGYGSGLLNCGTNDRGSNTVTHKLGGPQI